MPNNFIADLIDHKERVTKYMLIAADIFYDHIMPVSVDPAIKDTLFELIIKESHSGDKMRQIISEIFLRAAVHDNSKFSPEEFGLYNQAFPELQKHAYGSDGYKSAVKLLGPAWKHHCEVNRHHPEHFNNGIGGMNDVDLIEMCCDWLAASERSKTDIDVGLQMNKARFGIQDDLFLIIENTVECLNREDDVATIPLEEGLNTYQQIKLRHDALFREIATR